MRSEILIKVIIKCSNIRKSWKNKYKRGVNNKMVNTQEKEALCPTCNRSEETKPDWRTQLNLTPAQVENFEFYLENKDSFLNKYGDKHILIHNKTVINVFDNFDDARSEALKSCELGTFLIQNCADKPVIINRIGKTV